MVAVVKVDITLECDSGVEGSSPSGRPTIFILEGKSRKGKNRIREHGSEWELRRSSEAAQCLDGCPGWFIFPTNGQLEDSRWIRQHDDPDFIATTK